MKLFSSIVVLSFLLILLSSCEKQKEENAATGYVDADYVYISAPSNDKIKEMYVLKGKEVKKGDKLFELESFKSSSMHEANKFMEQSLQSYINDMKKGARQEDIDEWRYGNNAIKEMVILFKLLSEMYQFLSVKNAAADQYYWISRQAQYSFLALSKAIEMHINKLNLPDRPDKIEAFEMAKNAVSSMLPYTQYQFSESVQFSPCDAIIFDIFYRKGELPGSGKPVIQLLPNENIKIVFYVNNTQVSKISLGNKVKVFTESENADFFGAEINYISPNIQYTDPLIYSLKNSEKLLFLVEAKISPSNKYKLHPGEVVRVEL